jgi:hypothetical protein
LFIVFCISYYPFVQRCSVLREQAQQTNVTISTSGKFHKKDGKRTRRRVV